MGGVCLEYRRLLRAYERTFIAWVGPGNLDEHGAVDACLAKLEKKYQALADHQQSCAACLGALGKGAIHRVHPRVWPQKVDLESKEPNVS